MSNTMRDYISKWVEELAKMPLARQVEELNFVRVAMHEAGPFRKEPVDCVLWVASDSVSANDYNPNSVATPEMELLRLSIREDGYTQPIVAWSKGGEYEVVDGFHRNRVGKECQDVRERVHGYLPAAIINSDRQDVGDRMASTIRHNRARGKHAVTAMSDIVVELKRRNWTDAKISKNLGMDQDEVLRLTQISGISELFSDQEFSKAWTVDRLSEDGAGGEVLSDMVATPSADSDRILHTWDKWECYKAGFHADRPPEGLTVEDGEKEYCAFLSDEQRFSAALDSVVSEWKHSCEHHLTNDRMNRIAWLGQAAMAYYRRIPAICRGGYHLLSEAQRQNADELALAALNRWLEANGRAAVSMAEANGRTEAELY